MAGLSEWFPGQPNAPAAAEGRRLRPPHRRPVVFRRPFSVLESGPPDKNAYPTRLHPGVRQYQPRWEHVSARKVAEAAQLVIVLALKEEVAGQVLLVAAVSKGPRHSRQHQSSPNGVTINPISASFNST
jgi:hypothetical protein